jgi:hypothetical protein
MVMTDNPVLVRMAAERVKNMMNIAMLNSNSLVNNTNPQRQRHQEIALAWRLYPILQLDSLAAQPPGRSTASHVTPTDPTNQSMSGLAA